ncbi:patatin-like phospholipase family protein [bacterium]|nr:patatin-like phospholipase family protein [bacterium]
MHDYSHTLKKVPLFSDLSIEEINKTAPFFKLKKVRNNTVVLKINTEGDLLYILKSGQVRIIVPDEHDGCDRVVATLGPGNYFGEMSLLTGESVSATVMTSLDSEFLTLDKKTFELLLQKYSKLSYKISMILSKRLRERNVFKSLRILPEKVSVFSEDNFISSKISFLLAMSLFIEGLNRVLIIDLQNISAENIVEKFHFAEATEKLETFIRSHDIGEDLKTVEGKLYEYSYLDSLIYKTHRKKDVSKQNYKVDTGKDRYVYRQGIYLLKIFDKSQPSKKINVRNISPLLGLVSQIYDVVLLNLGNAPDAVSARAMSQSDMTVLVSEKSKKSVQSLKSKLMKINHIENFHISSPILSVFAPDYTESDLHHDDTKAIFQMDNIKIKNFPVSRKSFIGLEPDKNHDFITSSASIILSSVAREITGKIIGLALGGGGARGYAHIGVLKIFEENRFPIDIVSGSSMGSLIGAAYCMTASAKETERIIRKELAQSMSIFDFTIPINSFIRGKRIEKIAYNIFKDITFADLLIPFYIVCVDLITGKEVVINKGLVRDAVMASSAIPGIFKPVRWKNSYLVDGSVINKVPANILQKYNADHIIAVNVTPDRETKMERKLKKNTGIKKFLCKSKILREILDEPNILQIINRSLNITNSQMAKTGSQFTAFEIKPEIEKFDFLNFKNFDPLVKAGEKAASKSINELLRLIYQ